MTTYKKDLALVLALHNAIQSTKKDNWRGNKIKEREIKNVIEGFVGDKEVERIFELIRSHEEY